MKTKKNYDFSGYATKNNIRCSDGRTIRKDAFKHLDGQTVPLVWQHRHDEPANVLGHALLENRPDGVYTYAKFNSTENGKNSKLMVEHGDVVALSIYANQLQHAGTDVVHGTIREVSLVLSGANPGALIDNVVIRHSDDSYEMLDDEAVIYSGEEAQLTLNHGGNGMKTVQAVYDTLSEEEVELLNEVVAHAASGEVASFEATLELAHAQFDEDQNELLSAIIMHALDDEDDDYEDEEDFEDEEDDDFEDDEGNDDVAHSAGGRKLMKKNLFADQTEIKHSGLSREDSASILAHAIDTKATSLKQSILENPISLAHGANVDTAYGINKLELLFPDAHVVNAEPDFIKRRTEWVATVLGGTRKTPFSRIKTLHADITADEARAKGYTKGNKKIEEVFHLLGRETTPTTIYKKQKLDRDDIIDVTTIDLVKFLKTEMRVMFDEERARAILIGDGREANDPDKIKEDKIRPIYKEDILYAPRVNLAHDAKTDVIVDTIIKSRKLYKGTGVPSLFVNTDVLTDLLLLKDTIGHRLYKSKAELASALRVADIIEVEVMDDVSRVEVDETNPDEIKTTTFDLVAIMVNLADYTEGADKGGEVSLFDDFDIDFNQMKYLMEARSCGALTKPFSALIFESPTVDIG